MDITRLLTILAAFLLLICLTLSITTLTVLRNTIDETDAWQAKAADLSARLDASLAVLEGIDISISTSTIPEESDTEVDILYNRFCVKETDGKIGIYSEEGYLVRLLDTDVRTLPATEREALSRGITVSSWGELLELIQDYT